MLDSEGFDRWALQFDESVIRSDEEGSYPFSGYRKILSEICRRILESGAEDVLDLGFGTGTLLKCLYDQGLKVYGQDYSRKMISIAVEKMPEAELYQGDLREGLAEALRGRRYDAIVSTYTLHHIPDEEKKAFLQNLLPLLRSGGCIYIGDVAFEDREALQRCCEASGEEWDEEEDYFVYEEIRKDFPAVRFEPFSSCGGLLTLESPVLTTERLVLRRWEEEDAETLFPLAQDPDVGPRAGWPPHQSIEESRKIIQMFLKSSEHYAVCLREDGRLIGAAALHFGEQTDLTDRSDECELGYWIGKPYWGRGYMTEAAKELIRRAFEDCGVRAIWCAYYDGNERSRRVQEKCGFIFQWTSEEVDVPQLKEKRRGHVNRLAKMDWFMARTTDRTGAAASESLSRGTTVIRRMNIEDYDKVFALWKATTGMGLNTTDDSREGIEKYLLRNPGMSFVAEENGEIVGVILSGHDGRRGLIYHLAVREDRRRQRIASRLLDHALAALKTEGIHKVFLVVFKRNEEGNAFWESRGFTLREDLNYRNQAFQEMVRIET